ncbi:prepilin peptidase [Vibrio viridaestus]|uniref:Prepilin type IV endopeptidase peptidase domain-containing protein n=1 Tax=Vibrio viridaestus TaxID=2487322 RepID=A0A3N9TFW0_9VIBR|nr:prepilin peptidase [Vibrio viridaestus]RQW63019.1 hypothetical protein EES38_11935 [Vibrio viridaestus]
MLSNIFYILILINLFYLTLTDLRNYRIPNSGLISLFIFLLILKISDYSEFSFLFLDFVPAVIFFLFGFLIYLFNGMSPGDVKFLFVIGFLFGYENMLEGAFFVSTSMVLIGFFYYLFFLSNKILFIDFLKLSFSFSWIGYQSVNAITSWRRESTKAIPFAPMVVFGVALFQYLNS